MFRNVLVGLLLLNGLSLYTIGSATWKIHNLESSLKYIRTLDLQVSRLKSAQLSEEALSSLYLLKNKIRDKKHIKLIDSATLAFFGNSFSNFLKNKKALVSNNHLRIQKKSLRVQKLQNILYTSSLLFAFTFFLAAGLLLKRRLAQNEKCPS